MSKLYVDEIASKTGSTKALEINSSGNLIVPQKIAFMAKLTSNFNPGTASRTKIPFATNNSAPRVFNYGGGFKDGITGSKPLSMVCISSWRVRM